MKQKQNIGRRIGKELARLRKKAEREGRIKHKPKVKKKKGKKKH